MMKYLRFDYEGLLREYKQNKLALKNTQKLMDFYEGKEVIEYTPDDYFKITKNPQAIESIQEQLDELKLCVSLVDTGLEALRETERTALKLFYVEGRTSTECSEVMNISSRNFFRVKNLAFDKFKHVVFHN